MPCDVWRDAMRCVSHGGMHCVGVIWKRPTPARDLRARCKQRVSNASEGWSHSRLLHQPSVTSRDARDAAVSLCLLSAVRLLDLLCCLLFAYCLLDLFCCLLSACSIFSAVCCPPIACWISSAVCCLPFACSIFSAVCCPPFACWISSPQGAPRVAHRADHAGSRGARRGGVFSSSPYRHRIVVTVSSLRHRIVASCVWTPLERNRILFVENRRRAVVVERRDTRFPASPPRFAASPRPAVRCASLRSSLRLSSACVCVVLRGVVLCLPRARITRRGSRACRDRHNDV